MDVSIFGDTPKEKASRKLIKYYIFYLNTTIDVDATPIFPEKEDTIVEDFDEEDENTQVGNGDERKTCCWCRKEGKKSDERVVFGCYTGNGRMVLEWFVAVV
ncbi:hypothetical protein V6N13_148499 [Hibiscus sabdariffa]